VIARTSVPAGGDNDKGKAKAYQVKQVLKAIDRLESIRNDE